VGKEKREIQKTNCGLTLKPIPEKRKERRIERGSREGKTEVTSEKGNNTDIKRGESFHAGGIDWKFRKENVMMGGEEEQAHGVRLIKTPKERGLP